MGYGRPDDARTPNQLVERGRVDIGGRGSELLGAGAVLLATVGYAVGPLVVKLHLSHADPVGPVTAAMAIASIVLLPFALTGAPTDAPPRDALASLAVLGLLCSALAFIVFFRLIGEVGPSRAAVVTYINPIVALALGVAILGEQVSRSGRRAASDPGRVLAGDRRARAAGPHGDR